MLCWCCVEQTGQYQAWEDFDRDMMLIRENCIAYNQEGTLVRRDCDELFAFYAQEYEKVLQKWQMVRTFCSTILKML